MPYLQIFDSRTYQGHHLLQETLRYLSTFHWGVMEICWLLKNMNNN